jgi:hypothetical protein
MRHGRRASPVADRPDDIARGACVPGFGLASISCGSFRAYVLVQDNPGEHDGWQHDPREEP